MGSKHFTVMPIFLPERATIFPTVLTSCFRTDVQSSTTSHLRDRFVTMERLSLHCKTHHIQATPYAQVLERRHRRRDAWRWLAVSLSFALVMMCANNSNAQFTAQDESPSTTGNQSAFSEAYQSELNNQSSADQPEIQAKQIGVEIQKDLSRLGIGQRVRPGVWTPLLVSLNNPLTKPVEVRIELLVPDADQDIVHYQRVVTLTPQRDNQQTWLYAMAPSGTDTASQWRLQVIDQSTDKLLDYQDIAIADRYLESRMTAVGIIGRSMMGLEAYSTDATQQEKTVFLRGLEPATLPDRWYGLSMLTSIIWTPQIDPAGTNISPDFTRALRHWVQRGGHLVIVLPTVGDTWPSSPLADLVPPNTQRVVNDIYPLFLGSITNSNSTPQTISMRVFEPDTKAGVQGVLFLEDDAWGIAHQIGRGRVSMLGVDLTDSRLASMGLPSPGAWTLWSEIFGWQGPALLPSYVNSQVDIGKMNRADQRIAVSTGDFIAPRIAMRDTAAPSLLLAIALFVVYWVVAGPVQFVMFKQMKIIHHAWTGFVGVVLIFTIVSWSGAYFLRPGHTQIRHVAVLTATKGQADAHVHAWLSLYVPTHGPVETKLGYPDYDTADNVGRSSVASTSTTNHPHNAIWSTGFASETQNQAFPDTRTYNINAAQPDDVNFAYRSTAKQLEFDYFGNLSTLVIDAPSTSNKTGQSDSSSNNTPDDSSASANPITQVAQASWEMPAGELKLVDGWPVGTLVHALPGSLEHVAVIYCDGRRLPGGRLREPVYWLYRDAWSAGKALHFTGKPTNTQSLVRGIAPNWTGRLADLTRKFNNDKRAERVEILTFFNMLPPPDYNDVSFTVDIHAYRREVGREFDLTALARMKCLIIIGHLGSAPLPAPLAVDGKTPPSRGDTIVRWIFPLHDMQSIETPSAPADTAPALEPVSQPAANTLQES